MLGEETLISELLLQPKEWYNYQSQMFKYMSEPTPSHLVNHREWPILFYFWIRVGSWWKGYQLRDCLHAVIRCEMHIDSVVVVCVGGKLWHLRFPLSLKVHRVYRFGEEMSFWVRHIYYHKVFATIRLGNMHTAWAAAITITTPFFCKLFSIDLKMCITL